MRLRLTKLDEYQFLTCVEHSLWGSKSARFREWQKGDLLAIIVDKALAGLARVTGEPFQSRKKVWDKDTYPHRIPIEFMHVLARSDRVPVLHEVRNALTSRWGPRYGWGILNQQLLTDPAADIIVSAITSRPNNLSATRSNIAQLLAEARVADQVASRVQRTLPPASDTASAGQAFGSQEEELSHARTQAALVRLGRTTGSSVWIAANDRRRLFQGRPLGDDCLRSLPNLGLSEEATKRISYIDTIWVRQSAPVCAFEVETSTSIYSGLLRLSDLLSVVPAINIKLFIVAPKERQQKVMGELARPTFQKIGLSEFCRFIACEDLDSLVVRVADLEGHISSSILDTIAVELEQDA